MRKIITLLITMLLLTGCKSNKPEEKIEEVPTTQAVTENEPEIETEEEAEEIPFNWQPLVRVQIGNLSFDYRHCEGTSLRSCPAQELIDSYYWVKYKDGGKSDADGYKLEGDGFEIMIVADIISEDVDTISFMREYVYDTIVSTGVDNIKIPPETRIIGNESWSYFATSTPNPNKVGSYIRMEQFALCKVRNELYSVYAEITDVNEETFNKVQSVLSSMQILTYQERVDDKADKTKNLLNDDFITKYDRAPVTGRDVLQTIENLQKFAVAVIVKTLQNPVTSVANYNTPLGDRNSRFDLTKLEIIGTPPEAERLKTTFSLDILSTNWDLEGALTPLSDDYIKLSAKFLSFLIYDSQENIIGVYFEQLK